MSTEQEKVATLIAFTTICLFALSSWIDLAGLWTELPLLVNELPEGWNLPSYLVIIVQVANIAPFSYMALKKLKPDLVKEWLASCVIIVIGIVASILLAFTWDKTSHVGEELHSTTLFVLAFLLALVDCTSSVVYLPYMARFKSPTFMTALYVGEGLCGLIPAVIGFAQVLGTTSFKNWNSSDNTVIGNQTYGNNTDGNRLTPRFSASVFFGIMAILLIISLVSFLCLHFHPFFDKFKIDKKESNIDVEGNNQSIASQMQIEENDIFTLCDKNNSFSCADTSSNSKTLKSLCTQSTSKDNGGNKTVFARKFSYKHTFFYFLVIWTNALHYGIMPSIQSFSSLPYGSLTYDLSVKLSILLNPLACLLTLFLTIENLPLISLVTLTGTIASAYQIFLAVLSPNPILKDGTAGIILSILSSVLMSTCFSFAKVCIGIVLAKEGETKLLLYCGAFTQVGCIVGAIVAFFAVNIFKVFKRS